MERHQATLANVRAEREAQGAAEDDARHAKSLDYKSEAMFGVPVHVARGVQQRWCQREELAAFFAEHGYIDTWEFVDEL